MRAGACLRGVLLLALLLPGSGLAARRVAVLVGANIGWTEDRRLRYAEDDARRLGAVLAELGGFTPDTAGGEAVILLRSPTATQLRETLESVARQLRETPAEQQLFLFYFSGHADRQALHLRESSLGLDELRRTLHGMTASVKLGIVDACQSGALAVDKGAMPAAGFAVSVRNELALRGTVILSSSGADEVSQEARILSGSFFTHHLVSGLRGAADRDGDRRVSVEEAYRYAALRTKLDTGGEQGPVINIELKGQGWLFLSWLKGPESFLLFTGEEQRCYLTDAAERSLVAEFFRQVPGRTAQLVVPPGEYLLKCVQGENYRVARLEVKAAERVDVSRLSFQEVSRSEGLLKGRLPGESPEQALARRLATDAELLRTERPDEIEPSVLLAIEALRRAPTLEVAQQALRRGLERLPLPGVCVKHEAPVGAVAWGREGAQLATASADGLTRLWAPEEGRELLRLPSSHPLSELAWSRDGRWLGGRQASGDASLWEWQAERGAFRPAPGAPLRAVVFDPRGAHVALWERSGTLRVVSGATGEEVFEAEQVGAPPRFSEEGRFLAAAGSSGQVRVWDVVDDKEVLNVPLGTPSTQEVLLALSPGGALLALGRTDALAVDVWDVSKARWVSRVRHEGVVTALAFTPDGALLTAGEDKSVRVWDAASGVMKFHLPHEAGVASMALSPDGGRLATTRLGGRSATVWELRTGREVARLPHADGVSAVSWSPRGDRLATAGRDGTACVWGLAEGAVGEVRAQGPFAAMAFSPDGQRLVTATAAEPVRVWEVSTGRELGPLREGGTANILALSPDGGHLAASRGEGVGLWELASGRKRAHLAHRGLLRALAFSPKGDGLVSAGRDGTVRLWSTATGREQRRWEVGSPVQAVAFSPDGARLAAGSEHGVAFLWDVETGRQLHRLEHEGLPCEEGPPAGRTMCEMARMLGTQSVLESVVFSPDGRYLGTATSDAVARVWELESGRELPFLRRRHADPIKALVFSPDGKALVIASGASGAHLWKLADGTELLTLPEQGGVWSLEYSADGQYLMTLSGTGKVRIREAATGREVGYVLEDARPEAVRLSPAGGHVAVAQYGPDRRTLAFSTYVWRTADLITQACGRLRRNLSEAEWLQYLRGEEPYEKTCLR
jgi:WD40 repeat protein